MTELNPIESRYTPEERDKHKKSKAQLGLSTFSGPGLTGGRGILVGVMAQAVSDLFSDDPATALDAYEYFHGRAGMFQAHLERLDLDPNLLPAVLEE